MKKLIISSVLGIVVAASSAFGQGWAELVTSPHFIWDDTGTYSGATISNPRFDSSFDVAMMYGTGTPAVAAIAAGNPTNNSTLGATTSYSPFSATAAWSDIMNDANFAIASSNSVAWVATGTASGGSSANGGSEFAVAGSTALTTYSVFLIAWNTEGGTLLTPQAASAAGAAVGWSPTFSYQFQAAPPTGNAPAQPAFTAFGIGYYPTPEPTTLALAGLGGISMLFLRRRKA